MAAIILEYLFTPDVIVVFDPIISDWYVVVNVLRSSFIKPNLYITNAKDDDIWTSQSVIAEDWSFLESYAMSIGK